MTVISINGHAPYVVLVRKGSGKDHTSHNKAKCVRCARSVRPACTVCGHSLSAGVQDIIKYDGKPDFEFGLIECEVCGSLLRVRVDEMI